MFDRPVNVSSTKQTFPHEKKIFFLLSLNFIINFISYMTGTSVGYFSTAQLTITDLVNEGVAYSADEMWLHSDC